MENSKEDLKRLSQKLSQLEQLTLLSVKEMLTIDDVSLLTGYSRNYLRVLVHKREIPFFKPDGRKLFFSKAEVNNWLAQNHTPAQSDLDAEQFLRNYVNS